MSWTKRQFVMEAYEEIGLGSYEYDLEPEQLQAGLRRLDAMMAQWNSQGIRIGYPLVSTPENSSLDTETNVPDKANEAIYLNLAMRVGAPIGRKLPMATMTMAQKAYRVLYAQTQKPIERQITGLPRGAGSKAWRTYGDRFLDEPEETLLAGNDSELEF